MTVELDNKTARERIRSRRLALEQRRELLEEAGARRAVLKTQHGKLKAGLDKLM